MLRSSSSSSSSARTRTPRRPDDDGRDMLMRRALHKALCAVAVLRIVATSSTLLAAPLPRDPIVRAGSVTVAQPHADRLEIRQFSDRAIVDWRAFDIGRDAVVDIVQPDAGAAILNRVTGATRSELAGVLRADGDVFLFNPNGIDITRSGVISAGGFVASMLDMRNEHFMTVDLRREFAASRADDENQTLLARLGEYAAGRPNSHGRALAAPARAARASNGISNTGAILVGSGGIVALIGTALSQDGWISANDGQIAIIAPHVRLAGRVNADGTGKGVVDIVGSDVGVNDARISASGSGSGGRIRISALGGPAPSVRVGSAAHLEADGWARAGDGAARGGRVHIRSTASTQMLGHASASAIGMGPGAKARAMTTDAASAGGGIRVMGVAGLNVAGTFSVAHASPGALDIATPHWGTVEFVGSRLTVASRSRQLCAPLTDRIVAEAVSGALATGHVVLTSRPLPVSLAAAGGFLQSRDDTSILIEAPIRWHADTTLRLTARADVSVDAPIVGHGQRAALAISHRPEQRDRVDASRIWLPGAQAILTIQGASVNARGGVRPGDS